MLKKIYLLFSPKFGMTITFRGTKIAQVRRGCDAYGATTHLAIGTQQGWHGTYLGLRVRVLLSALVQFCQIIYYCAYHDGTSEKREGRKRGAEELMTALTKQQKEATQKLQVKYDGDPKPVNSSGSLGGG